jgi:hypothetical protein
MFIKYLLLPPFYVSLHVQPPCWWEQPWRPSCDNCPCEATNVHCRLYRPVEHATSKILSMPVLKRGLERLLHLWPGHWRRRRRRNTWASCSGLWICLTWRSHAINCTETSLIFWSQINCTNGTLSTKIQEHSQNGWQQVDKVYEVVQAIRNNPSAAHQSKSDTRSKAHSKSDADLIEDSDRGKVVNWLSTVEIMWTIVRYTVSNNLVPTGMWGSLSTSSIRNISNS